MKKVVFTVLSLAFFVTAFSQAKAADLMVASAMQRCVTNDDCVLVTGSCADNCGFIPVNKQNLPTLQSTYQQRCGKTMEQNPSCQMNPPINAACINSRCTIDYAYANNAGPKDYQSGVYPAPEPAVPSQVPANAAPANDRHGFTAYQLEEEGLKVREDTLGQIPAKVYAPSTAPVNGGNYVPVAPATNAAPAANIAPATTPVPAPAPADTRPAAVPATISGPANVQEVPAPKPVPTATTTPNSTATLANPIPSSASSLIPEPRVPEEEPMLRGTSPDTGNVNAPIPPSEYKSQTFVPPPGSTIPVSPEDPGAKPPEGTILQAPVPRGPDETPTFGIKKTETRQDKSFN